MLDINKIIDELIERIKILEKLKINEITDMVVKKPYKCPVCAGIEKRPSEYKCHACEGKGIVWG